MNISDIWPLRLSWAHWTLYWVDVTCPGLPNRKCWQVGKITICTHSIPLIFWKKAKTCFGLIQCGLFSRSFFILTYSSHWVFHSTKGFSSIQMCPLWLKRAFDYVADDLWVGLLLELLSQSLKIPIMDGENKASSWPMLSWSFVSCRESMVLSRRVWFTSDYPRCRNLSCFLLEFIVAWTWDWSFAHKVSRRAIGMAGLGEGVWAIVNVLVRYL